MTEEEEEERMALYVSYLLISCLLRFPLSFPISSFSCPFVTLAIPGKQLPSLVVLLNSQSDPTHIHGHFIISSHQLAPFHLCLHFSTYYLHCHYKIKQRRWCKKKRRLLKVVKSLRIRCKMCECYENIMKYQFVSKYFR